MCLWSITKQIFCRSSFVASLGGAVASTPIDVVRVRSFLVLSKRLIKRMLSKVRLMNQRRLKSGVHFGFGMSSDFSRQKPRIYRGTIDCLVQVREAIKNRFDSY